MEANNFSLGIVIGAALSNSIGSAFHTLEKKFTSLEAKSQNLKLTKALSHKLKSYENTIKNLEKQREEYQKLGKATDEIDRKLEIYKLKLKGVKLEAIKAGISIRDLRQDTEKLGRALEETKRKMKLGEISGKITAQGAKLGAVATTGALTLSTVIKPAIDFESAFADVKKVIDFASKEQEKQFRNTILDLSTKIPLSAVELSQIAAQGGQLGISVKDLPDFTKLVAKMATAFDMIPEQAGEAFAKLSNIYGLSMKEAEELADAINALGNNTAAKEKDIINTLGRIGGIAKQFGLAKESAAALADAFIALGKPPEVAATSINALLGKLNTIETQSPQFKQAFEKVMPIEEFKRLKQENPEKALLNFLHRLKQLDKQSQANVIAQMFGQEYADDIALLVGSLDQYAKALDVVSDKEKYKGALDKEFEARSKTTENNIKLLANKINKLAIVIGSVLLPPLNKVIGVIGEGIGAITGFIEKHEILGKAISFGLVAFFGLITASLSLSMAFNVAKLSALMLSGSLKNVWNAGNLVGKALLWTGNVAITGLVKGFAIARTATLLLGGALRTAFMLNPIGMVITAVLALGTAGYMVIKHWDKVKAFFGSLWQFLKKGFSLAVKAIGMIIENSPLGMAIKAGKWIFSKIFGKKEEQKKEILIGKTITENKNNQTINKTKQTKKQQIKKEILIGKTITENKNHQIINKTEQTKQQKIKKEILQKSAQAVKKIEASQKTYKIEFGKLEVKIEGQVQGDIDEESLVKKIASILEEKVNRKVEQVLMQIREDNWRRAY